MSFSGDLAFSWTFYTKMEGDTKLRLHYTSLLKAMVFGQNLDSGKSGYHRKGDPKRSRTA